MNPMVHPREGQLNSLPIASHLVGSEVLKLLREEEGVKMSAPQGWPQPQHGPATGRPGLSFMTKCARTGETKQVVWPPKEEGVITTTTFRDGVEHTAPPTTFTSTVIEGPLPPPVPPRPANYPQVDPRMEQQMSQSFLTNSSYSSSSSESQLIKQSYEIQQPGYQGIPQPQSLQIREQSSANEDSSKVYQVPIRYEKESTQNREMIHNINVISNNSQNQSNVMNPSIPVVMDQPKPPVATAAENYQNIIKQQNEQLVNASPVLPRKKQDGAVSVESFPSQWPPTNQQNVAASNTPASHPAGLKLKEQMPIEQPVVQVVPSQPAFKISKPLNVGGDQRWPPKQGEVPQETTQSNVRELIKPKKQNRDYSEFFAQNALPTNYTSYRAPPGTQHHGQGISNM